MPQIIHWVIIRLNIATQFGPTTIPHKVISTSDLAVRSETATKSRVCVLCAGVHDTNHNSFAIYALSVKFIDAGLCVYRIIRRCGCSHPV
jgi:hypothetical protein